MNRLALIAALAGFMAVLLGAFGAHGLKGHVEPSLLPVWQTAVQYQMMHSLVLLVLAVSGKVESSVWLRRCCWFLVAGMIIFCGSLYVLVLTSIKPFGMLTPFGGVCFLIGWVMMMVWAIKGSR